jgi:hypothetical protein
MNESWALGSASTSPLFSIDLPNADVRYADLAPLAPLRPIDSSCAGGPELLADGNVVAGLHDDTTAAVFVGRIGEYPWKQIGRRVTDVVSMSASVRSGAWILTAFSGHETFCVGGVPPSEDVPDDVLVGSSVQVILPEREVVFENHEGDEFVFHESGRCAIVRGTAHDFPTDERTPLPGDATQVVFW